MLKCCDRRLVYDKILLEEEEDVLKEILREAAIDELKKEFFNKIQGRNTWRECVDVAGGMIEKSSQPTQQLQEQQQEDQDHQQQPRQELEHQEGRGAQPDEEVTGEITTASARDPTGAKPCATLYLDQSEESNI